MQRLKGRRIKSALIAGITWFKHFRSQVDNMNVFPVPDGDTGKNMNQALQAALEEIKGLTGNNVSDIVWAAARGALMGGRGCSGMILSGFFTGFAEGVGDRASLTAKELAKAFQVGCLRARERVDHPQEGTILTVGEAAAKKAVAQSRLSGQLNDVVLSALEGAKTALQMTPTQLKVLKENNVVDAGGMGLVFFFEGMARFIHGQSLEKQQDIVNQQIEKEKSTKSKFKLSVYKYCTEFIIHTETGSVQKIKQIMQPLGEELMVAQGEEGLFKVHIHTKDPKPALEAASQLGMITWKKVDDMEKQHQHHFKSK